MKIVRSTLAVLLLASSVSVAAERVSFDQALYAVLRGAVSVRQVQGGYSYTDCYDPGRLAVTLADAPPYAWKLLASAADISGETHAALSTMRVEFEASVAGFVLTREQATWAYRDFLMVRADRIPGLRAAVLWAVEDAGLYPGEGFEDASPAATQASQCSKLPCPQCDTGRCDCSTVGCEGRVCDCRTPPRDITKDDCAPPRMNCSTDEPKPATPPDKALIQTFGW